MLRSARLFCLGIVVMFSQQAPTFPSIWSRGPARPVLPPHFPSPPPLRSWEAGGLGDID